jgi:hypothetical protein
MFKKARPESLLEGKAAGPERTEEYVSAHDAKSIIACRLSQSATIVVCPTAPKGRPTCAKPLRRRQGTPLTDFFNILQEARTLEVARAGIGQG